MPAYDGAGTLFARGLRLTKLAADGSPLEGAGNCYITDSLVTMNIGLTFTENDAIEQRNGKGQICVSYRAPDTLQAGAIEALTVCTPDPNILQFLIGGSVIIGGGTAEVQTLTVTGTPTGGAIQITFNGETTGDIDFDATASEVGAALLALPNVDSGDIVASGGPLPGTAVVLTFGGQYAGTSMPLMTVEDEDLTGGTTPAAAIAETTPGVDGSAIGYRAPEVNTDPTPNGVAIEAWTNAILDNAPAGNLPYFHWVLPRAHLRLSENFELSGENAGTPIFAGTCEQNGGFGDGPVNDVEFGTDRVWQFCRVADDPTVSPGFVTVLADA